MDEEVRVINNKVPVGNGVPKADESVRVPGRDERVGTEQSTVEQLRFLSG